MRGRGVALLVARGVGAGACRPASAKTHWLCKPGTNAVLLHAAPVDDGALAHRRRARHVDGQARQGPEVDCFYVYPTVSDQKTPTATFSIDPEDSSIVLYQAARYTQHCRLFAPVYRQLTLQGIGRRHDDGHARAAVRLHRRARRLARLPQELQRRPRPVVLIGHSQGSFVLRQLDRARRSTPSRRCASCWSPALLLGGNVLVPQGQRRGRRLQARPRLPLAEPVRAASSPTRPSTARCRRDSLFGRSTSPGRRGPVHRPGRARRRRRRRSTSIFPTAPFAPGTTIGARHRPRRRAAPERVDHLDLGPAPTTASCVGRRRCRRTADQPARRRAGAHRGARRHLGPASDRREHRRWATSCGSCQRQFRAYERQNAAK